MSVQYLCDICGKPTSNERFTIPISSPMGDWEITKTKEVNLCDMCQYRIAQYIKTIPEAMRKEAGK